MTPAEAGVLLTMCAAFDNRKPDPDAAKAWAAALDGLRFDDCRLAIIAHFRTSSDWLMPAKVRADVQRIRNKRIAEHGQVEPPSELTPAEYAGWLKETRRRIGDGETITPPAVLPAARPRPIPELLSNADDA